MAVLQTLGALRRDLRRRSHCFVATESRARRVRGLVISRSSSRLSWLSPDRHRAGPNLLNALILGAPGQDLRSRLRPNHPSGAKWYPRATVAKAALGIFFTPWALLDPFAGCGRAGGDDCSRSS